MTLNEHAGDILKEIPDARNRFPTAPHAGRMIRPGLGLVRGGAESDPIDWTSYSFCGSRHSGCS